MRAAEEVEGLPLVDLGFARQDLPQVLSTYALTYGGLWLLGGRAADLADDGRLPYWAAIASR